MSERQSATYRRLRFFGIDHRTSVSADQLTQKWIRSSGTEWTVERLKALKQYAIQMKWGEDPSKSPPLWLSVDQFGYPRGPFGRIFRLGLLGSSKRFTKLLNSLMVYSQFISQEVTPKQWKKFYESATMSPSDQEIEVNLDLKWLTHSGRRPGFRDIDVFPLSSEKRTTDGLKSVPENEIERWLPYASRNSIVRSILHRDTLLLPSKSLLRTMLWNLFPRHVETHDYMGTIGLIQESGYKLRAVANPNRVIQIVLDPLKTALGETLKRVPQDYTFDQDRAASTIQEWLVQGSVVSSIDLSDATNNFPLRFTLKVLSQWDKMKMFRSDIQCFKESSLAPWRSPYGDIRWTKGQPLGLGPSFFAFSLSHHALIQGLGITEYCVLGDDVVIRHLDDASVYRQALVKLGCPVSEGKTFQSSLFAEFAGNIITHETVMHPFKWKLVSDQSFFDHAKNLGPKGTQFLRHYHRKAVMLVAELPEWEGGLGWNPKGKTIQQRIDDNIVVLRLLESPELVAARQPGFRKEVLRYLLNNGLTFAVGMPHESYAIAGERQLTLDSTLSTIVSNFDGMSGRFPPDLPGMVPVTESGDPRKVHKILSILRSNPDLLESGLV